MVNQNNIFSFKIKHQAKTVFLSDVERLVSKVTCNKQKANFRAYMDSEDTDGLICAKVIY